MTLSRKLGFSLYSAKSQIKFQGYLLNCTESNDPPSKSFPSDPDR